MSYENKILHAFDAQSSILKQVFNLKHFHFLYNYICALSKKIDLN